MQLSDSEKAELAEVYEKAAEYLEEYGWLQGDAGEEGQPRCFIGATASAVGEDKTGRYTRVVNDCLWHRANRFAGDTLGLSPSRAIFDWNDEKGRTEDEVINTLHALANKLR